MSALSADSIYALLPATIRIKDSQTGNTLKDLVGVLAQQAMVLDDNLAQLYDDLFIQTCSPWAIPYIGELIGYRALRPIPPNDSTTRADVADTIGYRRRKGTLAVLDQLAADITGWPAVAVEFFQRLAVSQYVRNHVRPQNACVDVHDWQSAADFNTAFDVMPRAADVRRIESGRGRYNIPNIGLFVWRLLAFGGATLLPASGPAPALAMSTAAKVGTNRYTFDPFGGDVPLLNPPRPLAAQFLSTQRANVPFPLLRFGLFLELEALRAVANGTLETYASRFFGSPPVLAVYGADGNPIAATQICACNLADWSAPTEAGISVAVDPELGRLMFVGPAAPPDPVRVAYAYGFSGPYGGGTYPRTPPATEATPVPVPSFASADASVWQSGVFEIEDSGTFAGDLELTPDGALVVRAAELTRPIVLGQVTIEAVPGAAVTLRGLGIRDGIIVRAPPASSSSSSGNSSSSISTSSVSSSSSSVPGPVVNTAFTLILEHCTLRGPLVWTYDAGGSLSISNCLCASIQVNDQVIVTLNDSSVDGGSDSATAIAGPDGVSPCGEVDLSACTVLGTIVARETNSIENSLVSGEARFERTQAGCVRYSYVPNGSTTPRRFRCQPDLAIATALSSAAAASGAPLDAATQQTVTANAISRVTPVFVSRETGMAGYLQLSDAGPPEIAGGAESGDEMGIFHGLYNGRRESNLVYRLAEYLRIGLEAGVIHAS